MRPKNTLAKRRARTTNRPAKIGGKGQVFCDEAGFTGNNLLDDAQEVFVFAGVAMHGDHALEVVERTVRDFRLQGKELKGSRLLKTDQGRRAITSVIKSCAKYARMAAHLKKFALACKFFEYIFEPALANQNSLFYGIGFHLYIGNLLFAMFRTKRLSAETIFKHFTHFMREGDQTALQHIFPSKGQIVDYTSDPMAAISLFAMINRNAIQEELQAIRGDGSAPNWVLDLTTTSLFSVLRHWGQVYDELIVKCDRSKPIENEIDILKIMVGRREHFTVRMFGKETQFTFNLTEVPEMVDSRLFPGVQIADCFASGLASALQQSYWGKLGADEKGWLRLTRECMLQESIWPDLDLINLRRRSSFINAAVLIELARRCTVKQDLFEAMPEFIYRASAVFPQFLLGTSSD